MPPPSEAAGLRRSRDDGGWSFACDPDQPAAAAPAIWQPRACAHVVIAEPAPGGFAAARLADLVDAAAVAAESISFRDWHVVLRVDGRHFRIWIRSFAHNEGLAHLAPADLHLKLRLALGASLDCLASGRGVPRPPAAGHPGPSERWRLVQWLRLLDALNERAPARELAAALILAEARRYSAAEWDVSAERKRIMRWQRAATAMRDGGYRRLLGAA